MYRKLAQSKSDQNLEKAVAQAISDTWRKMGVVLMFLVSLHLWIGRPSPVKFELNFAQLAAIIGVMSGLALLQQLYTAQILNEFLKRKKLEVAPYRYPYLTHIIIGGYALVAIELACDLMGIR